MLSSHIEGYNTYMLCLPVFAVLTFQSKFRYEILLMFNKKYFDLHISAISDNHYSPLMC